MLVFVCCRERNRERKRCAHLLSRQQSRGVNHKLVCYYFFAGECTSECVLMAWLCFTAASVYWSLLIWASFIFQCAPQRRTINARSTDCRSQIESKWLLLRLSSTNFLTRETQCMWILKVLFFAKSTPGPNVLRIFSSCARLRADETLIKSLARKWYCCLAIKSMGSHFGRIMT